MFCKELTRKVDTFSKRKPWKEKWKKKKKKVYCEKEPKPKKHKHIRKGAISFQNELFFRNFLNYAGLDKFVSAHPSGLAKTKRLRKTKVHVRPRNKQKHYCLLFITYIGLTAFIFKVFLSWFLPKFLEMGLLWSKCCLNVWDKMSLKE